MKIIPSLLSLMLCLFIFTGCGTTSGQSVVVSTTFTSTSWYGHGSYYHYGPHYYCFYGHPRPPFIIHYPAPVVVAPHPIIIHPAPAIIPPRVIHATPTPHGRGPRR